MKLQNLVNIGVGTVLSVAIIVIGAKSCATQKNIDSIKEARSSIKEAEKKIEDVKACNDLLRDSVHMWQDSTEFYKSGLKECENAKKNSDKVVKPAAGLSKQSGKIVLFSGKGLGEPETDKNVTKINLKPRSSNSSNVFVQNDSKKFNNTEIVLGEGVVNSGNIVVSNGGNVIIKERSESLDSLRMAVDSLKQNASNVNSAAASSIVLVKTVKTYSRTR